MSYIPIHARTWWSLGGRAASATLCQSLKWRQCIISDQWMLLHLQIFTLATPSIPCFSHGNTHVNKLVCTHVRARCSWVTGSGINVIPCWWLKSVGNRDVSKGDQSRLAQDTAGGLFGLLSLTQAVIWESARSLVLTGGIQGQPLAWSRNANAQLESTDLWLPTTVYLPLRFQSCY